MRRASAVAAAIAGLAVAVVALLGETPAAAAPSCSAQQSVPHVLQTTGDVLEYGIFDSKGRFFYSDQTADALMRLDRFGGQPVKVAAISAPGAIVFAADGSIIIGQGDSVSNGSIGDQSPKSSLLRVNPDTGATKTYATGLGMANGVALAPDGTIYATNDIGDDVDRITRDGKTQHPWATVHSANGIVVSPDDRYVYVDQTFTTPAIERISIANPRQVTSFATGASTDATAGLDDMTSDARGNLYVAANGGGQIWKVTPDGVVCVLASGLVTPSAVNFGVGVNARNLYVVGFDGHISELPNVLPAAPQTKPKPKPKTRPKPKPKPKAKPRAKPKPKHKRHQSSTGRPCADPDTDRDCDAAAPSA